MAYEAITYLKLYQIIERKSKIFTSPYVSRYHGNFLNILKYQNNIRQSLRRISKQFIKYPSVVFY